MKKEKNISKKIEITKTFNINVPFLDTPVDYSKELIDKAAVWLGTVVNPVSAEYGLLLQDEIRSKRVMNQVTMLLKVKEYVESKGISIEAIPMKILVPLLDGASLEEEEDLQELWAKMLTNMLDSDTNYKNQIFPYLLGQISKEDFDQLGRVYEAESVNALRDATFRKRFQELRQGEIPNMDDVMQRKYYANAELDELARMLADFNEDGAKGTSPHVDNLERLGLIKEIPPQPILPTFTTGGDSVSYADGSTKEEIHELAIQYSYYRTGFRLTEIGRMFFEVCTLDSDVKK